MQAPLAAGAAVAAGAAFAVPLPVLVVNDATGARHRGLLQLPRLAPPAPVPPSAAVLARLDPLLRAHGDALAAQTGGLDPERLSRTYAALMAELQEAVGMRVDAVELTPESLQAVLPGGQCVKQIFEMRCQTINRTGGSGGSSPRPPEARNF